MLECVCECVYKKLWIGGEHCSIYTNIRLRQISKADRFQYLNWKTWLCMAWNICHTYAYNVLHYIYKWISFMCITVIIYFIRMCCVTYNNFYRKTNKKYDSQSEKLQLDLLLIFLFKHITWIYDLRLRMHCSCMVIWMKHFLYSALVSLMNTETIEWMTETEFDEGTEIQFHSCKLHYVRHMPYVECR